MARPKKRKSRLQSASPTRRGAVERTAIAFRLPVALLRRVDAAAERAGVSRTWKVGELLDAALRAEGELETREASDERQIDLFA
jgi:hypothetical protein